MHAPFLGFLDLTGLGDLSDLGRTYNLCEHKPTLLGNARSKAEPTASLCRTLLASPFEIERFRKRPGPTLGLPIQLGVAAVFLYHKCACVHHLSDDAQYGKHQERDQQ